jgi:hypothetical protein
VNLEGIKVQKAVHKLEHHHVRGGGAMRLAGTVTHHSMDKQIIHRSVTAIPAAQHVHQRLGFFFSSIQHAGTNGRHVSYQPGTKAQTGLEHNLRAI